MNRLYLFRALQPTARYPATSLDLEINSVGYDLILPNRVGIALAKLLSPKGSFQRREDYCSPSGFASLRTTFRPFGSSQVEACYAEADSLVESFEDGVLLGNYLKSSAANDVAAVTILKSVIDGELPFDVIDWIFAHAPYLDYCGGFEIVHWLTYASPDERDIAFRTAAGEFDDAEPNRYQPYLAHLHDGSLIEEEAVVNRLCLFRALHPDEKYPKPLFDLGVNGQRFDLLTPEDVADSLIGELTTTSVFLRLRGYCTPKSIAAIERLKPLAFDPAHEQSVYVEAARTTEVGQTEVTEIVCNALAAADLFRIAMEGDLFSQPVADWILNRSPYFLNCGGLMLSQISHNENEPKRLQ